MTTGDPMQRLLNGELLEPDEEAATLAQLAKSPGAVVPFASMLVHQRRRLRRQLDLALQRAGEAEARIAGLTQPPLLPAAPHIGRLTPQGRLLKVPVSHVGFAPC